MPRHDFQGLWHDLMPGNVAGRGIDHAKAVGHWLGPVGSERHAHDGTRIDELRAPDDMQRSPVVVPKEHPIMLARFCEVFGDVVEVIDREAGFSKA